MNNYLGLVKHDNNVLCTGFIIRAAISRKDITLITGATYVPDITDYTFEFNNKSYDIKLHHIDSSGLILFTPVSVIDNLWSGRRLYELYNPISSRGYNPISRGHNNVYFICNDHQQFELSEFNYDKEYTNQEGNVITNEAGQVVAIIVNQKCIIWSEIEKILKETLNTWFSSH